MNLLDLSDDAPGLVHLRSVIRSRTLVRPTVRLVFPPPPGTAERQKELCRRLSRIRTHPAAFGFVRNKSCYKAAMTHAAFWGFPAQGDVSYLKADLRNFFHSVDGDKVSRALEAHHIGWVGMDDLRECGALRDWREEYYPEEIPGLEMPDRAMAMAGVVGPEFQLSELMLGCRILERALRSVPDGEWEALDAYFLHSISDDIENPIRPLENLRLMRMFAMLAGPCPTGGRTTNRIAELFPLPFLLNRVLGDITSEDWSRLDNGDPSLGFPEWDWRYLRDAHRNSTIYRGTIPHPIPTAKKQAEVMLEIFRFLADNCCDLLSLPRAAESTLFTPQGASTSPVLSNLAAKPLDYRMRSLAENETLCYTRYADDMVFSWSGRRTKKEIGLLKWGIAKRVESLGFVPNLSKFMIMGPGMRQKVLGYAMNSGVPTIPGKKRKEVLEGAEALLVETPSFGERGRCLRDLKRSAGLLAWCYEAHRSDARISDARDRVDGRIRTLLSGGMSAFGEMDLCAEHHDVGSWNTESEGLEDSGIFA